MIVRLISRAFQVGLLLLASSAAVAQEPIVISGRVIDKDGTPVAGQEVVLHRVAGQDGARVGQTVSAEDGAFRFTLDQPPAAGTVHFATARYEGEVYIGAMLEPPIDPGKEYVVVVGGEPVSFDAPVMPPSTGTGAAVRPPAGSRRWALAIVPLLAVLGAGLASILSRRGQRERRHLLIRLAALEEEVAVQGETEGLRQERARIIDELGGRPGT